MVVLSKEKAEFKKNWDKILTICNEGGTINGKVKAAVKGGLLVNIGVEAFLPASQIDIVPPHNLAQFIGNTYEFKVVKINQERQNIVLSRRELIEQQRNDKRSKLLSEMTPATSARAPSRISPTSARSSISTASTASSISPT